MKFENNIDFAKKLDQEDPLKHFRDKFYIPMVHGKDSIYFTGNSLGLQPKTTQEYVLDELEDWANYGVEGHFHARNPWVSYHELFPDLLSEIVGGLPEEIVVMNQLTVNLHILMTSFYRPTKERFKIICEAKAFPSDQYAFASQATIHGLDPEKTIIEVAPREGEHCIHTSDILAAIKEHGKETALVLFSGVNYYNGQVFDMEAITKASHEAGAYCGFDLAHAAGNIKLKMHEWNADFACWCSYKYLNSGPGGVSGVFIHQRHMADKKIVRLAGWWGQDKATRFKMEKEFNPIPTAEGWQLSNAPVLSMAAHKASLDIFKDAGMDNLIKKGKMLAGYLKFILEEINNNTTEKIIEVITPQPEMESGCQVSMLMLKDGKNIFEALKKEGVIADWREPNVIRIAPVPLYNSFEDVFKFGEIISNVTINK
ncbi:MAG: kynureninase [Ferruginibacter sp.]|nr:kynureninase [Ferruginibacter sp.]